MKKPAVVTTAMDTLLFGDGMQACAGVVIRRVLSISLVMGVIMALAGSVAWGEAGVSLVMNGSFENDGEIEDITVKAPQHWCDVNVPDDDRFDGWVRANVDWLTHHYDVDDGNCLTLYTGFGDFYDGEMATVSQEVYLMDVNQVIFDLKLVTTEGDPWPDQKRSAVVLIDYSDIIWDSNDWTPDGNGEYRNHAVTIDQKYRDSNSHILSLGIKANVSETEFFYEYLARWDFVKFDTYCGGFGYLWEDLNLDCYVDMRDLEILAGQWLAEDPNEEYDLFQDGIVNFRDFAFFAEYWMSNTYWENWQDDNCFEMELLVGDIDDSGEVNYGDIATFVDNWLSGESCNRADLNEDGFVNFQDFAILADQWLQISWLYRL